MNYDEAEKAKEETVIMSRGFIDAINEHLNMLRKHIDDGDEVQQQIACLQARLMVDYMLRTLNEETKKIMMDIYDTKTH